MLESKTPPAMKGRGGVRGATFLHRWSSAPGPLRSLTGANRRGFVRPDTAGRFSPAAQERISAWLAHRLPPTAILCRTAATLTCLRHSLYNTILAQTAICVKKTWTSNGLSSTWIQEVDSVSIADGWPVVTVAQPNSPFIILDANRS